MGSGVFWWSLVDSGGLVDCGGLWWVLGAPWGTYVLRFDAFHMKLNHIIMYRPTSFCSILTRSCVEFTVCHFGVCQRMQISSSWLEDHQWPSLFDLVLPL